MAMRDPAKHARRTRLLTAIQNTPGEWTTGRAVQLNLAHGDTGNRNIARADLEALTTDGHLIRREHHNRRFYVLNHAKDGTAR